MKFKILMFGGQYASIAQLTRGIYSTDIPELYSADVTTASLIEKAEQLQKEMGVNLTGYIDNIKKCNLVECDLHLSIDSSTPIINNEFLADVRGLVDYDYESEQEHYDALSEDVRECHIFKSIKRLDEALKSIGK